MNLPKSAIIASSLSLLLCSSLLANEVYTIKNGSLQDAIKKISKISNMTFMVDTRILEGKKAPSIKNISGLKNALKEVLKNTNLEAIIKDKTIIIRKKVLFKESSNLGEVDVIESSDNTTEGSSSYTIKSMNTATKLNLSIRDTPQSVVVITNQQIQDKNLESFQDLAQSVIGFNAPDWDSGRFWISSRGFNVDYYQIDGIPTAFYAGGSNQDLITFDRVEIVKGANGLTTGAGEPAASINYVRKHAIKQEFGGKATIKTNSFGAYSGSVDMGMALNEDGSIRARIVANHNKDKSFKDLYEEETNTFYTIVDADVTDRTSLYLGASYLKEDTKGSYWTGAPVFYDDGSLTHFSSSDNFSAKWASYNNKTMSVFSGLEHTFLNDIKLKANYSYVNVKYTPNMVSLIGYPDKTTGLGLEAQWGAWHTEHQRKTHALDFYASIPLKIANKDHELILGSSFSKTKELEYWYDYTNADSDFETNSVHDWKGDIVHPSYLAPVLDRDEEKKQYSIYATGKFNLSEALKLITGARISTYKYKCNFYWDTCANPYEHKNVFTPFVGLTYGINKNHSLYTSYTSIFKPQDYKDKGGERLDPEEGKSYEVGIKGEYFDKKLNASLVYFKTKKENVGEVEGTHANGDDYYKVIDGVTSKGIEFTIAGEIKDNWNVDFGFTSFSVKDSEGKESSTLTPKKEISLSSKYKIGKLSLGGGINWQDAFYNNVTNPSNEEIKITQKAFYLANAMIKYDYSKKLSFQLNVDNLFDKEYYSNITYGSYGGSYMFGDPRTTTLSINYKF